MTHLPDALTVLLLEADVIDAENRCLEDLSFLIRHLNVDRVLALVADAYRTFPAGSLLASRGREVAENLVETGLYLHEKTGL